MIIKTLLRRGTDHKNYAEDALVYKEMNNFVYACVFDGCSSGVDSHFASALFKKAFNDITSKLEHVLDKSEDGIEKNLKFLTFQIARKVYETKQLLDLKTNELLSTMVICVLDKGAQNCMIAAFGDGYFRVDETECFIKNTKYAELVNSENRPHYLSYNLDFIQNYNDFEEWYSKQPEKHFFEDVTNITIASDGLETFSKVGIPKEEAFNNVNAIDYLVRDEQFLGHAIMMEKKYNILNSKCCLLNKDDLSLIRIKVD